MDQLNLHKQKLYALIAAGVAFISLLLRWISVNFLGVSNSVNGFRGWGIASLLGIIGVFALTLLSNRMEEYNKDLKKYVTISFAVIAAGALLFFLRKNSVMGGANMFTNDLVSTGIGLWICLIAGLAGIALLNGLIKFSPGKTL
jgi:hypothetical protein